MPNNTDSRYFCVDENISPVIAKALDQIYKRQHRITSVGALRLNGAKDTELIPELAQRGVNVLITQDRRQLLNKEETQALIDHGIHWAGFPLPDDPQRGQHLPIRQNASLHSSLTSSTTGKIFPVLISMFHSGKNK